MRIAQLAIDITPLRERRDYRWLFTGRCALLLGSALTETAATWQVFDLTHSSLAVGLNLVIGSIAMVTGLLAGGMLADRMDRRKVLIRVRLPSILLAVVLALNSTLDEPAPWVIVLATALIELMAGLGAPASFAAVPSLVGTKHLTAAGALNGMAAQLSYMAGPAMAGVLIAGPGIAACYSVNALGFVVFAGSMAFIRPLPPAGTTDEKRGLGSLIEGCKFAGKNRILVGVLLIDANAMLCAMPKGLFPVLALENIGGGATTFGLLAAAPGFGAIIGAATSGWTGRIGRPGMGVICASLMWGMAILCFGLSTSLPLTLFFLALAGASDLISEVLRSALLQHHTPDRLRGRVTSVWLAQANLAPALGNARAGAVAQIFSATSSVISGGLMSIVGALLLAAFTPALRNASITPATETGDANMPKFAKGT